MRALSGQVRQKASNQASQSASTPQPRHPIHPKPLTRVAAHVADQVAHPRPHARIRVHQQPPQKRHEARLSYRLVDGGACFVLKRDGVPWPCIVCALSPHWHAECTGPCSLQQAAGAPSLATRAKCEAITSVSTSTPTGLMSRSSRSIISGCIPPDCEGALRAHRVRVSIIMVARAVTLHNPTHPHPRHHPQPTTPTSTSALHPQPIQPPTPAPARTGSGTAPPRN